GGAVFWPLPLETVREQHDEPARAQPLGFARGDELIDDALGAISEVAELRLPQHQSLRVGERIAIFEAKHAELGQRAVTNLKPCAFDRGQRDVFLTRLLIDPNCVTLAEGTAAAVLARQANAVAFRDQASVGERLRRRPVEPLAAREHLLFGVKDALKRLVDGEA